MGFMVLGSKQAVAPRLNGTRKIWPAPRCKFRLAADRLSQRRCRPMSQPENAPSPQLFFDTISSYQRTGALKPAVDLGLSTAIGSTPSTATEIAARCQCPERGIRILSDNLVILGFLTKDGAHYALTPSSTVFLDQNSPAYTGGAM